LANLLTGKYNAIIHSKNNSKNSSEVKDKYSSYKNNNMNYISNNNEEIFEYRKKENITSSDSKTKGKVNFKNDESLKQMYDKSRLAITNIKNENKKQKL